MQQLNATCQNAQEMQAFAKTISPQQRAMLRAALDAVAGNGAETEEDGAWPMNEDEPAPPRGRQALTRSVGLPRPMRY